MKLNSNSLTLKTTAVALRNTDSKSTLKKLGDAYSEHAKLVFLFDVSASMDWSVAQSYTEQYIWTPEILADIRRRTATAIDKCNAAGLNLVTALMGLTGVLDPNEEPLLALADSEHGPNGELSFSPDDEELKERIVRHNLIGFLNIGVDFSKKHEKPPTRIELVKKLAKVELENRFKKFPRSRVAVIPFASYPYVIFDDGQPEALWPELEKLSYGFAECGAGTNIMRALREAIEVCRRKPSPVGIHHFIVVSDGEDSGTSALPGWVPMLKQSGVVLDYIHIGDSYRNPELIAACKELGGEFASVNSVRELEKKFVAAMNRLLAPPK